MNAVLLVRGLIESAPTEEVLLSGAGDGVVKVWRLGEDGSTPPTQIAKLQNGDPVLSLAVDGSFLYCGLAGGGAEYLEPGLAAAGQTDYQTYR